MNRAALFCDETIDYRIPEEADPGDEVILRFRTAKDNVDHVRLILDQPGITIELQKKSSEGLFDYYETTVLVGEAPLFFYFEIVSGDEVCYYSRLGFATLNDKLRRFCIMPGLHVPEWAKGALMYQIFIDRFCNGDPTNDVESDEYVYIGYPVDKVDNWKEGLSVMDVDRFYGGDIQGIWDHLDYLQSLKVEVIYLNPIFVSPSNHKYDCQDYEHVDPHYGVIVHDADGLVGEYDTDNQNAEKYRVRTADMANLEASDRFFARFMKEVHSRGMRVILDGVFNHCGSFNKWLDREKIYEKDGSYAPGAYGSADSPYHDFFRFGNQNGWPDNDSYEGWWGHNTLPKLNYEGSPELYQYILDIAKKWLSPPYSIDGWRLDVAADLGHSVEFNHQFWKDFRKVVKETNPDALILAEHYGDASSWLDGTQWDTVMNYDAFMEPVSWFLTGLEKHSEWKRDDVYRNSQAFMVSMLVNMSRLYTPCLYAAMNELSNHDHSRFLTRTNRMTARLTADNAYLASEGISLGIFRAAVVLQMTWPGAPTIYYGDEAGLCGFTDPDNRRTYPWGRENLELIEFHRYMIGIRNRNRAFRTGSLKVLLAENGVIAYGRFSSEGRGVVVINSDGYKSQVRIPVWETGITRDYMVRIMLTSEERYNVGQVRCPIPDGILTISMPPRSSMVFEEKVLDF